MPDHISLTTAQAFELERMSRAIDATQDPALLQLLCKQLHQAWMVQQAAATWAMRQGTPHPPSLARLPPPPVADHPSSS